MTYEVLARKWRPKQFVDVVGQQHVTQTLMNAIQTNRIAHAYLFVGPRGIGKTSVARIFAKALNCVHGPTVTPCDQCDSCREIAAGNSFDVLEIDGASNTGVEHIRDLRETVKYAPASARFKIYIIDEVHMLSTAAFNALLKTLEEPPPHVKFIFATTEPHKILPTIISRCQRFDLRRIPVPLIVERLRQIAAAEQVQVDEDALLAIARGAEGGLRDAESALDQLISFRGSEIKEQDVLAVFGLVARATLEQIAASVLRGDMAGLLALVAHLDEAGKDLQRVVGELLEHFRNLLVCLHVPDPAQVMDVTEAQLATLREQAALTDSEKVLRIMQILTETEDRMKTTLSRRALLEAALIRCARAAVVVSLENILAQIKALAAETVPTRMTGAGGLAATDSIGSVGPQKPAEAGAANGLLEETATRVEEVGGKYAAEIAPPAADDSLVLKLTVEWREVVERVAKLAPTARGALLDARPLRVEGDAVLIGLDREFANEMKDLEISRNRRAIEQVLTAMFKRPIKVKFTLADVSVSEERTGAARSAATTGAVPTGPGQGNALPGKKRPVREWAKDPAVRKGLEIFGGTIVDVRE